MPRLKTFSLLLAPALLPGAADADFFEMKIRPLLARQCFSCHAASKMGGLDATSRAGLEKGGGRGTALGEGGTLLRAVAYADPMLKMPPSGKLTETEIADLSTWVKGGAVWPESKTSAAPAAGSGWRITPEQRAWWAFQPVRKPAAPAVKGTAWARTEIDRFVLNKLEAKGLRPVAPAPRAALIRRAYYDLTGLPPTAGEVEAFEKDKSPDAFAKVVERLLASKHYGERWGRYWLDTARYSDDRLNSTMDSPYEHAYYYRDWVIDAFNRDMPYNLFVKAQIAADQMDHPDREKLIAGLGFYALSPEFQDDRVDATARAFLGLTVACAQCHDHKFDPIPTRDFYALSGVFASTKLSEYPLAPAERVKDFKDGKERIEAAEKELADYLDKQALALSEILAAQTARYVEAVRTGPKDAALDAETLERWTKYLAKDHEHPFLKDWKTASGAATRFQGKVLEVIRERKKVEETNFIRLGGSQKRGDLASADLLALPRDEYLLWRDLFNSPNGILYYKDEKLDRFLAGQFKQHLDFLRGEVARRKQELPEPYPFIHTIADVEKPHNVKIRIRGSADNLGEEAVRSFLTVLSKDGQPAPFTKGSGRLELAEAIADPANPLTARVAVNRLWKQHFGAGLSSTPSNFGQLGEKPSHPELLDYLAARFVEQGWSMKALHREIMNSAVYQLAAASEPKAFEADPDNRLYWRANRKRLDIEPLRDTLLAVTGEIDLAAGGKAEKLTEATNKRRTVYGFVSRRKLDGTLSLFDFPNPNSTSEQRIETATPLQALFFLNSTFLHDRSKALAAKLADAGVNDTARIQAAYRRLYHRAPTPQELKLGLAFLAGAGAEAWPLYAQALLSANELLFVN
ncbi:MAG: PSD1 domain-containing protein [Bryobacterales bacterium]|nr:PSD1 domain-containing protein [Bryobacterales bacterium]